MVALSSSAQGAVEQAVAAELLKFQGVASAVSSTALRTDKLPAPLMMRAILRNFHPKRSGDICRRRLEALQD